MQEKLTQVGFFDHLTQSDTHFLDDLSALREVARRALIEPYALTHAEIQEIGFALLVATRDAEAPLHGAGVDP